MKISVITPTFNAQTFIERAIDSVMMQKYDSYEHIIIDGLSNDNTLKIIKKLKYDKLIILSEKDQGIYDAINKGIYLSSGQIVTILGSDDFYISPYIFETVSNEIIKKNYDVVFTNVEYCSPYNKNKIIRKYNPCTLSTNNLSRGIIPAHSAFFFRKEILQIVGFYNSNYQIAGDFEFFCRLVKFNNLRYSYLSIPTVRMNFGGISTTKFNFLFKTNFEIIKACRQNLIKINYFYLILRYFTKIRNTNLTYLVLIIKSLLKN
jgi:glycosyltransferase involved in cell wall biosynthesis